MSNVLGLGMLFKTFSAAVFGIDTYLVETEVDLCPAYEGTFSVAGLPGIAVKSLPQTADLITRLSEK